MKNLILTVCMGAVVCSTPSHASPSPVPTPEPSPLAGAYRQYYSGWSYQPSRSYYVRRYYYKPATTYTTYNYHYCVYYPRTYSTSRRYTRYIYYYNPKRRVYWGRFDLEGEPGKQYSLLKKEDQKADLEKIPEEAFPKPGKMPFIPESEDEVRIEPLKKSDLPDVEDAKDLPKSPGPSKK